MPAPETSSQEQLQPGETLPKEHVSDCDTHATGSTGLPVPWLMPQPLFWPVKQGNAPGCSGRACPGGSAASAGHRRGRGAAGRPTLPAAGLPAGESCDLATRLVPARGAGG